MSLGIPPAQVLGELAEVLQGQFSVTCSIAIGPARFSRNMVVVQARLVLVSSVRLDEPGLDALDALGRVAHVVRLAGAHGSDDPFYKYPYGATVWALKGQRYFRGVDPESGETYFQPDRWIETDTKLPIPGAAIHRIETDPPEGLLRLELGGGTLVAEDSLQNWAETDLHSSWAGKLVFRANGFIQPLQLGPGWAKNCKPSAEQLRSVLALDFENLLPAHGTPVLGAARKGYQEALSGRG